MVSIAKLARGWASDYAPSLAARGTVHLGTDIPTGADPLDHLLLASADDVQHAMLNTMVTAIAAGVVVIAIAHRLKISSIVLLLLAGVALGPAGLQVFDPENLGDGLPVIISLAVGLILFEGGLTLDLDDYRKAKGVIPRLLSIGALITWFGTAASIWFMRDWLGMSKAFPFADALLVASLVIVTGPTVIAPLLKRIRVNQRLHSILHWEGVLIDPIGVFIALLTFEWIESRDEGWGALADFGIRFAAGLFVGGIGGVVIERLIRWRIPPRDMLNVFAVGMAVLIFGLADAIKFESGLLAVTVAGFVVGAMGPKELKSIRAFKAEMVDLLVGMLFILLAARLDLRAFVEFGLPGIVIVGIVMLVVRPLNVAVCSWKQDISFKEKLFLSWVAPRGIVAASMASLFAVKLEEDHPDAAGLIETFTYSVIAGTVILQGFTAGPLAALLRVRQPERVGWLIVGSHDLARGVARFLRDQGGVDVLLVDTNPRGVAQATAEGLSAICADARDPSLESDPRLSTLGRLLVLTDNAELNVLLCQHWREEFGPRHLYRWGAWDAVGSTRREAGTLVWDRLPKPSLLSAELARDESVLSVEEGAQAADSGLVPLLRAGEDGITITDAQLAPGPAASGPTLHVHRDSDYLVSGLRPAFVLDLDTSDLTEVLTAVTGRISEAYPVLSQEGLLAELVGPGNAAPSGLGHGVAVPHVYAAGITGPLCAIARLTQPLQIHAPDDIPVRLVIFLVSPVGDSQGHLATLAEAARLVSSREAREVLATGEPERVVEYVRAYFDA